jgi:hypothetical protein
MPVKTEDRPLKNIREEVIDQLVMNYGHEEITLEAFEKRLDTAMETEDREVLLELVADLELKADAKYQQTKAQKLSKDKYYFDESASTDENLIKVLSSSTHNGPWVVPENMKVTSILSDLKLDYSEAIFKTEVVHLKLFSLLSSDTIFVPEGTRVVTKTANYLSTIKSQVFGGSNENAKTIVLHGNCILSSITIKVRVTMKEKWLNFADNIKKLFN